MTEPEFTESLLKQKFPELAFNYLVFFIEELAEEIRVYAGQGASDEQWADTQALKVVEEAGEFIGAWNRLKGFCRRSGDMKEVTKELSDVIIASFVMFAVLDEDAQVHIKGKLWEIITRGYVNKDDSAR